MYPDQVALPEASWSGSTVSFVVFNGKYMLSRTRVNINDQNKHACRFSSKRQNSKTPNDKNKKRDLLWFERPVKRPMLIFHSPFEKNIIIGIAISALADLSFRFGLTQYLTCDKRCLFQNRSYNPKQLFEFSFTILESERRYTDKQSNMHRVLICN